MNNDKITRMNDRMVGRTNERAKADRTHMDAIEARFPLHEHNENAQICTGAEYRARNGTLTVPFRAIGDTAINGFPLYVARNAEGELEATFHPNTHAMIIGSTGSGKTTGFALPFLNWMSAKKDKPNIIVSDPKQEQYRLTASHFINNGYKVVTLDFNNYRASDCWNPLTKIFRAYQEYLTVEKDVTVVREGARAYNSFRGTVFKRQKDLAAAIAAEKGRLFAEVDVMIGSIAEAISPVAKKDDPYWDQSASTLLRGFLWAMLEDSVPEKTEGRITEETYSFDTLIRIYDSFGNGSHGLNDHGYFSRRDPETSVAYQLVNASIIELSANVTRSCITSCFSEKIKMFRDTSVRRITCANTIDIEHLDDADAPTVIFISYKDEDSLHYSVISLFIADLYTSLIGTSGTSSLE